MQERRARFADTQNAAFVIVGLEKTDNNKR